MERRAAAVVRPPLTRSLRRVIRCTGFFTFDFRYSGSPLIGVENHVGWVGGVVALQLNMLSIGLAIEFKNPHPILPRLQLSPINLIIDKPRNGRLDREDMADRI